jgi:hypothetical protein
MNCDECKEQVFELIEQEAIDPAAVRALLARCPDCQSLFDELKEALRTAAMLPLEEPPLSIDAAIVRAAAARQSTRRRSRWRRLQAPPLAMAAVALLAIGIGVWTIPRGGEVEGGDASTEKLEANDGIIDKLGADQIGDSSSQEPAIAALEAEPVRAPREAEADRPAAALRKAGSRPARAKQRAAAPAASAVARQAADARAALPEATTATGVSAELEDRAALDIEGTAPRLAEEQRKEDSIATCRRRVAEHESAYEHRADATIDAEQALALGRCYQRLGNEKSARQWLLRAAGEPVTKARAERALRELDAK